MVILPFKTTELAVLASADWHKAAAVLLGAALAVLFVIYLAKLFLRLFAFGLCAAAGVMSAVFWTPAVSSLVHAVLTPDQFVVYNGAIIARAIAFLVGHLLCWVALGIIARPFKSG